MLNRDADDLLVGAARAVITPPLGVSLAGSYTDRRADGVRHDLYARALVIDGGTAKAAIVSVDLIGVRAATTDGVRRLVEQRCGIPGDHVLIAATHNHSGPLTRELAASGLAGENDEEYLAYLERQIASAVELASRQRRAASLRLTVGEEGGIAFNRRFFMREGPARTNPGKLHPDVVRPAGPADPRVWTLSALPMQDGKPATSAMSVPPHRLAVGLLVNFGLHPAIVGGAIMGGDFPYFLETGVQRLLGPGGNNAVPPADLGRPAPAAPVVLFANAPCADVNHLDVSHRQPQGGFAEAARIGTILAAEVTKTACRLAADWEVTGSIAVSGLRRRVDLALRRPTAEQVAWARGAMHGRMTMLPGAGLEVVEAHRIVALADGWTGDTHPTEVQALAIGADLAIVGLPGEIFADLGLDLRARSPFRHTLVLGLANEAIGYVPSRRAYAEGGYEPTSSRLQPGSGERLVEEALALLASLRGGAEQGGGAA
jgi:neutral ceramidase